MTFSFSLHTSLATRSGSLFALQNGRQAKEVTAVTLTRTNAYGPTWVKGAELSIADSPYGKLPAPADPLLAKIADRPMSGAEMGLTMVDHLSEGGEKILANVESDLIRVMKDALNLPDNDPGGEEPSLADLRSMAQEQGQDLLVKAADRFTSHASDFRDKLASLRRTFANLEGPQQTEEQKTSLVRSALGTIVDAQLEPQKVKMELDALRGAALLQMTGASREQVDQALKLRRATGRLALQTKRKGMVEDLMRDYKSGRIAATFTTKTVWADQQVETDASKATGTTVTMTQTFDHYASAMLTMSSTSATALTLRRL